VIRSGTRKEDLLYHPDEIDMVYDLRRAVSDLTTVDAMSLMLEKLKKSRSNIEFLLSMKR
jgi:Transcription termination factor